MVGRSAFSLTKRTCRCFVTAVWQGRVDLNTKPLIRAPKHWIVKNTTSKVGFHECLLFAVGGEDDHDHGQPSPVQDSRLVPQQTEGHQGWKVQPGKVTLPRPFKQKMRDLAPKAKVLRCRHHHAPRTGGGWGWLWSLLG